MCKNCNFKIYSEVYDAYDYDIFGNVFCSIDCKNTYKCVDC